MFDFITRRSVLAGAATLLAGAALARVAAAQSDYPSKQITWVVPYNPGGMSDSISRIMGEKLAEMSGVDVINDYKSGAGGTIGANYFAGVEPDGYTILQSTNNFYATIPEVHDVNYDPEDDFTPLVMVGEAPMVMAVNPSTGLTTLDEVLQYAKENPGALAYATSGLGTVGHLIGVWLQEVGDIELLHIPYDGGAEAMQATLSGEAQIFFGPEAAEPIRAGQLTGIAVLGDQRWDGLPELPSTVEAGVEGWAPRSWHAITVLSDTPDEVKEKLASMLNEILAMPDVQERISGLGLIPMELTPEELRERANADRDRFSELLRAGGVI